MKNTAIHSTHTSHTFLYKSITIMVNFVFSKGAGKSTFIENLGMKLIKKKNRVAVIPVDPSSHISGGSILGEK